MKRLLILLGVSGAILIISLLILSNFIIPIGRRERIIAPFQDALDAPLERGGRERMREQLSEEEHLRAPPSPVTEIVENELKKLFPGQILFNVPQEMKVGIKERVEVRISKTIAEDLSKGLKGRGLPQIEEIRVNTLMGVRLNGDNFDIKALSHEEQIVAGEGFTQWDWDVMPLESGTQSLLLTVTVRIKIPNYAEERKDYPVFERKIKVKVNQIYSIKRFIKSYWQWFVSTIIGSGIIGWIVKKRRKLRKKK